MKDLPVAFKVSADYFDVRDTLECGQVFRFKQIGENAFAVFSADKYAEAETEKGVVTVRSEDAEYFWKYFDLDSDYAETVKRISAISPLMEQASSLGKGIRILNQNFEEMVYSFIISAQNRIPRIKQIVERICLAKGEEKPFGRTFPKTQVLAECGEEFFAGVGAGYRSRYLDDTAKRLLTYDAARLNSLDSVSARKELLTFMGVGPKVADCILLFGMHRGDVFPVDTWIKKVYHNYFENGHKDGEISDYFCGLFGSDAGLCQQYLFYFERKYRQIR